jgi:UDP-N-acetylglucosamine:LPS N-acetylglucosamine transferase
MSASREGGPEGHAPLDVRRGAVGAGAVRALILSAEVGESHVAMGRSLAEGLRRRDPTTSVLMRNDFSVLGAPLGRLLGGGYQFHLGTVTWSYNITYRLFTGVGVARRFGELALYALGGSALAATVTEHDPDVVVTTHPVITTVAGRLRAAGRLRCPVAAVVGPLGGLAFWVHPGVDLHLLIYPESLPDVERDSGASATVAVQPLVREEFFSAPTQARARAQLGLAAPPPLVLISAGGWGAGDLLGAVDACLAVPGVHVVTVAGRNEQLRRSLEQRHGGHERVTVLGFTEQMTDWLSAADAFVTTTAGLSCLEAQLCGCPTVCYGSAIGHVRDNTNALARAGLARTAATPAALTAELTAALAAGRQAVPGPRPNLPSGAAVVEQLARGGGRGPAATGQRPRRVVTDAAAVQNPDRVDRRPGR